MPDETNPVYVEKVQLFSDKEKLIVTQAFDILLNASYKMATEKGFWEKARNDGELLALVHSEISEALEAIRKGNPESTKIPGFSNFVEELADAVIRICDFTGSKNLDLGGAILAKMQYNSARPYKHGKKF